MVTQNTVLSVLALTLGIAVPQVAGDTWYTLGVRTDWTTTANPGGGGATTYTYSVAAMNMNTGATARDKLTGVGRGVKDICGATLFGAQVLCYGDITKPCSDYSVAAYNSRRCRTICTKIGDYSPVKSVSGIYGYSQGNSLICDAPM